MLDSVPIEQAIHAFSVELIVVVSVIIAASTAASFFIKRKSGWVKTALFLLIVVPSVALTAVLSGGTIYTNILSETGGPVHWHADFEIWKCGERVDLIDPTSIENRIGSPLFHEHNDFRVHVEGTVMKKSEVTMGEFFRVIGGSVSGDQLTVPTNNGDVTMRTGDLCGGKPAVLQAFVYRTTNPGDLKRWVYVQEKLDDLSGHILAPFSTIPPGDCVVIELDGEKDSTERICETTRISVARGESRGG